MEVFVLDNSFRSHHWLPLIIEPEPQRDQRAKLEASQQHHHMTIELKTIQDVKDFVEISSKYHDSDIVAKQGRYIVDGKSILGIFSLNLLEPMVVIADSENDNLKISFYNTIEKWKVDNRD